MSEHLFKFLLSELTTVRIACRGKRGKVPCGYVAEVPLEHLDTFYNRQMGCPFCNTSFGVATSHGTGFEDGFAPLAQAIRALNAASKSVAIEFVLPDNP